MIKESDDDGAKRKETLASKGPSELPYMKRRRSSKRGGFIDRSPKMIQVDLTAAVCLERHSHDPALLAIELAWNCLAPAHNLQRLGKYYARRTDLAVHASDRGKVVEVWLSEYDSLQSYMQPLYDTLMDPAAYRRLDAVNQYPARLFEETHLSHCHAAYAMGIQVARESRPLFYKGDYWEGEDHFDLVERAASDVASICPINLREARLSISKEGLRLGLPRFEKQSQESVCKPTSDKAKRIIELLRRGDAPEQIALRLDVTRNYVSKVRSRYRRLLS